MVSSHFSTFMAYRAAAVSSAAMAEAEKSANGNATILTEVALRDVAASTTSHSTVNS